MADIVKHNPTDFKIVMVSLSDNYPVSVAKENHPTDR